MRMFITLILASWVTACATTAAEQVRVQLTSEPPGAKAQLIGGYPEFARLGQCQTPCELSFRWNWGALYDYSVIFEKDGFVAEERKGDQGEDTDQGRRLHAELMDLDEAWRLERARQDEIDAADLSDCLAALDPSGSVNRDAIPCRRSPPRFPLGMDAPGHCDLSFTIGADGRTRDITVLECSDPRFDRASQRALSRWIYLPAKTDGMPMAQTDIKTRILFVLE